MACLGGAGLALTPIGWGALAIGAAATATVWGIYKFNQSGIIEIGSTTHTITSGITNILNGNSIAGSSSFFNPANVFPNLISPVLKVPPYNGVDLGLDGSVCPGEGFEWKGKGPPGSGRGNWVKEGTNETLHPDLTHPQPIGPHWDYDSPDFPDGIRIFPNGTWVPK